jgi:4'-phosphopantetheinyl transferase
VTAHDPAFADGDAVHVWACRTDDPRVLEGASGPSAALNPEEIAQSARFFFAKDRRRYLATRSMVRHVLSRYIPLAPAEWCFRANAHGRPAIANAHELAHGLDFNISHTDHLIAIGVARNRRIGLDIEFVARDAPFEVTENFAPEERAMLASLDDAGRAARFWELWTLKESYIKARGIGLSLPLDQFRFSFDSPGIRLHLDPAVADDAPERWQFALGALDDNHCLAVCAERRGSGDTAFVFRHLHDPDWFRQAGWRAGQPGMFPATHLHPGETPSPVDRATR